MPSKLSSHTSDPVLATSRVFIGKLNTDRISNKDVFEFFKEYGEITGVSLHKGYAFVQYESEAAARIAVEQSNNTLFFGQRIDCRIASEGKKSKRRRSEDFDNDDALHDHYENDRDRSPPHFRQRSSAPDHYFSSTNGSSRMTECQLLGVGKSLRSYLNFVEKKLREKVRLKTHSQIIYSPDDVRTHLDEAVRSRILFTIVLFPQHDKHKSATLHIHHSNPAEHRNMPLADALALISSSYEQHEQRERDRKMYGQVMDSANCSRAIYSNDLSRIFNMVAQHLPLSLEEIDRAILHLQNQKNAVLESKGIVPPPGQIISIVQPTAVVQPVNQIAIDGTSNVLLPPIAAQSQSGVILPTIPSAADASQNVIIPQNVLLATLASSLPGSNVFLSPLASSQANNSLITPSSYTPTQPAVYMSQPQSEANITRPVESSGYVMETVPSSQEHLTVPYLTQIITPSTTAHIMPSTNVTMLAAQPPDTVIQASTPIIGTILPPQSNAINFTMSSVFPPHQF